jgi:hypothetical protein
VESKIQSTNKRSRSCRRCIVPIAKISNSMTADTVIGRNAGEFSDQVAPNLGLSYDKCNARGTFLYIVSKLNL